MFNPGSPVERFAGLASTSEPGYIAPAVRSRVISAESCDTIVEFLQRCRDTSTAVLVRRAARVEFAYTTLLHVDDPAIELIAAARARCLELVRAYAGAVLYPEFTILAMNFQDDVHVLHADNARFDVALDAWVPNHTPQRTHSALLYLNRHGTDFAGGRLHFPQYGLMIEPEPGLLVAFPSDERHLHEVEPIRSGFRISMACWYTPSRERAE